MCRAICKRGGKKDFLPILMDSNFLFSAESNKQSIKQANKFFKISKERKILHCIVMCRANCKRGGEEGLSTDSHGSGEARRRAKESLRDESLANP